MYFQTSASTCANARIAASKAGSSRHVPIRESKSWCSAVDAGCRLRRCSASHAANRTTSVSGRRSMACSISATVLTSPKLPTLPPVSSGSFKQPTPSEVSQRPAPPAANAAISAADVLVKIADAPPVFADCQHFNKFSAVGGLVEVAMWREPNLPEFDRGLRGWRGSRRALARRGIGGGGESSNAYSASSAALCDTQLEDCISGRRSFSRGGAELAEGRARLGTGEIYPPEPCFPSAKSVKSAVKCPTIGGRSP